MMLRTYFYLLWWHVRTWLRLGRPGPYKVMLQFTNRCNSKCKNCLIWTKPVNKDPSVPEVKHEELVNLISELSSELMWIAFTGGEPTLKVDEVVALTKEAKRLCPKLSIVAFTTNALLPQATLELAKEIKALHLDCLVTISLDGDEATHDHLRGVKGNFQLAWETLNLLRSRGIKAHFGLTISRQNLSFLKDHFSEYAPFIKAITFTHSEGIYDLKSEESTETMSTGLKYVLKHYRVQKIHELVEYLYLRLAKIFFAAKKSHSPIPCSSLQSSLDVFANGDVAPCMFLPAFTTAKNFTKSDLSSPRAQELREQIRRDQCPKCWMNCYAPHAIMHSPLKALKRAW